jgi:hypothetical protein
LKDLELGSRGQTIDWGPTEELATIGQLLPHLTPKKKLEKLEDKAEENERVLDWMRTNGWKLSDEETPQRLLKLPQYFPPKTRSPEDRDKRPGQRFEVGAKQGQS